jgi:ABC-type nitrate/sulfonate/bicarbonate transport system substrate-binding protein
MKLIKLIITRRTFLLLTVALVATLAGCERKQAEQPAAAPPSAAPSTPPAKVTIGYGKLRISLPVFLAERKGYFKAENLDVTLQPFDTAQPLADALVSGHIPMGGFTAYPITMTAMQKSGAQLYFIGTLNEDKEHPISMLLKKKARPSRASRTSKARRLAFCQLSPTDSGTKRS